MILPSPPPQYFTELFHSNHSLKRGAKAFKSGKCEEQLLQDCICRSFTSWHLRLSWGVAAHFITFFQYHLRKLNSLLILSHPCKLAAVRRNGGDGLHNSTQKATNEDAKYCHKIRREEEPHLSFQVRNCSYSNGIYTRKYFINSIIKGKFKTLKFHLEHSFLFCKTWAFTTFQILVII